jgi:hypothetical protein
LGPSCGKPMQSHQPSFCFSRAACIPKRGLTASIFFASLRFNNIHPQGGYRLLNEIDNRTLTNNAQLMEPTHPPLQHPSQADTLIPHVSPWSISLMIAQDNKYSSNDIAPLLQRMGYDVTIVRNINDAYRCLSFSEHEIAFFDLMLYNLIDLDRFNNLLSKYCGSCDVVVMSEKKIAISDPVLALPVSIFEVVSLIDALLFSPKS